MRNSLLLVFTALVLTASLIGCNMFKGAGKDLENTGENIQKTVDKNN